MTPSLADLAPGFAATIIGAVRREYPNAPRHVMTGPDDMANPSQLHPAFYGCFDWHSAVEMHWALLRLLPLLDGADREEAERVLDEHLSVDNVATEAAYLAAHPGFERPYGWGWSLALAEASEGTRWADALAVLAGQVTAAWLDWLPRTALPNRQGAHANTAFALARSWPWARLLSERGDGALAEQITLTARRWYGNDRDYPAQWEPGAGDFLSPALAEAELMSLVLPSRTFALWLDIALPGLAEGHPATLFTPLTAIDSSDGQAAHHHGLNLHRAAGFRVLQRRLGTSVVVQRAARQHLSAGLAEVRGSHWMAEHWLAAYAVLALD